MIVPLLTIMTGTYTRTISQEKETKIAYVAQEVMEKVRLNPHNSNQQIKAKKYVILIVVQI